MVRRLRVWIVCQVAELLNVPFGEPLSMSSEGHTGACNRGLLRERRRSKRTASWRRPRPAPEKASGK